MSHETHIQHMRGVTIRRLSEADGDAVVRLAQLDSAPAPTGALLGAEIEGRLVAATPISGGRAIADPFSRTAELAALLELRAGQLRAREPRARRRGLWRRGRRGLRAPSAPAPPGGTRLASPPLRPY